MKTLTYGEISDGGTSVFRSVAKLEDSGTLIINFVGVLRVDNPARYLAGYVDELAKVLPQYAVSTTTLDFVGLTSCNDHGFFALKDIVDTIYSLVPGSITVRRRTGDDWQNGTLPNLVAQDDESAAGRTSFEDVGS
jgi:hypothetical protein